MKNYKVKIDGKDYELKICDEVKYADTERIINDALDYCFTDGELISYSADFAIETALVLNTVTFGEFDGEAFNVEFFWKLINEYDIISEITKHVKNLHFGKIKKAFFNAYNEKMRVSLSPWSSAAVALTDLLKTFNSNQETLSKIDVDELMKISATIAQKDEGKIVDGILDFHEKTDKK